MGARIVAALSRSAIRQRLQARVVAVDSTWHHTVRMSDDVFFDTRNRLHKAFRITAGRTLSAPMDRQKRSRGVYCKTEFVVRLGWSLKGDNHVATYDTALDAVDTIGIALLGASEHDLRIVWASDDAPDITFDGTFAFADIRLICEHIKALS